MGKKSPPEESSTVGGELRGPMSPWRVATLAVLEE